MGRNLRKAAARLVDRSPTVVVRRMTTVPTDPRLALTVSQAARHLGVSIATVRRWSNAGHLPGYRTPGGQRRFTAEELDAFVDSLQPRHRAD